MTTPPGDAAGPRTAPGAGDRRPDAPDSALRQSEERYHQLVESAQDWAWEVDASGAYTFAGPQVRDLLGYEPEEVLGKRPMDLMPPEEAARVEALFAAIAAERRPFRGLENINVHRDGRLIVLETNGVPILDGDGRLLGFRGTDRDVTERAASREALRLSEEKFAKAFHASPDSININRLRDGMYVDVNPGFVLMSGYTREEVIGRTSIEINLWADPCDRARLVEALSRDGQVDNFEATFRVKDGSLLLGSMSARVITLAGEPHIVSVTRDVTDRKRVEAEKAALQAQILQSQKIESVGRLAGGVAHDFNNMLGVIIGHAELALMESPSPLVAEYLQEILATASRSADLTRQLLAFARRQTVRPIVLDLNAAVSAALKMLQRLVGEDIVVVYRAATDLWPVRIDPTQVDQVLANLLVNARDAMTGGGTVTIETANTMLDEAYCAAHLGATPGDYVRLAVSDTGHGMTREVLEHAFEPFFTTKGAGQGTGLGLSTVYGVVRQNDGLIDAESTPGAGTTVSIWLPRAAESVAPDRADASHSRPASQTGNETLLVVEDEESILDIARSMLTRLGYRVLVAPTPEEALRIGSSHEGPIDLLLTDVVMPGMNGRELAARLTAARPGLKCLFMSGYSADIISRHGVLADGVHLVQKPFSMSVLADSVRKALGR